MPTPRPLPRVPVFPPQASLAQRAAHHFPTHACIAGFQLLAQDRVALADVSPAKADATVRSKRARTVRIRSDGSGLSVACTCWPSSIELGACKHVWAALLAIDRRGGFELGGTNPLRLTALAEAPPPAAREADKPATERPPAKSTKKKTVPSSAKKKRAAVKRPRGRPRAR